MERGLVESILRLKKQCRFEQDLCEELDLTTAELGALRAFTEATTLSCGDAARAMGLSPSRATRIVDRLAGRGLVSRAEGSADRRCTLVSLSASGARALKELRRREAECEERLRRKLSGEELAKVQEAMAILLSVI